MLVTCGAEPARELDEAGYLVVGRVVEGAEAGGVLRTIEQAPVGADDEPLQAISVSACGLNAQTGPLAGAAGRSRARPQNLLFFSHSPSSAFAFFRFWAAPRLVD